MNGRREPLTIKCELSIDVDPCGNLNYFDADVVETSEPDEIIWADGDQVEFIEMRVYETMVKERDDFSDVRLQKCAELFIAKAEISDLRTIIENEIKTGETHSYANRRMREAYAEFNKKQMEPKP